MHVRRVRLGIASAPLAAILLLAACEQPQAPVGAMTGPQPQLDVGNAPPSSGSFVVRLADRPIFYFNADVRNDLMSIHIAPDVFFCGGGASFNLGDVQFVSTPSAVQQFIALIQDDDGAVAVYGTSDFTEAFGPGGPFSDIPRMCAFMNGPLKLAEGTARRVSVLSNTAFAVTWTGTLADAEGGAVAYSEHQSFLINPATGASATPVAQIRLQPIAAQ